MICPKCETRMPNYYNKCPVCGYSKLVKEESAPQVVEEEEEVEPISALVVDGDIDDIGGM